MLRSLLRCEAVGKADPTERIAYEGKPRNRGGARIDFLHTRRMAESAPGCAVVLSAGIASGIDRLHNPDKRASLSCPALNSSTTAHRATID